MKLPAVMLSLQTDVLELVLVVASGFSPIRHFDSLPAIALRMSDARASKYITAFDECHGSHRMQESLQSGDCSYNLF